MFDADDSGLMLAAANGDERAFAAIVGKYQDVILNFFQRSGVSYSDACDLAQKVFLRLWKYRGKYVPTAKLSTFLFMMAKQVEIDHFRSENKRARLYENYGEELADGAAKTGGENRACDPEKVRDAVSSLPEGQRKVVEMALFGDLPYAEVSERLGVPVGTVKSRMFTALRKLKELLK